MLAYLLFEALSLNDYCNVVKTNDSSLLKYMAIARLCASTGIFVGWVLNFAILHILGNKIEPEFLIAICLVVVVATSTLAFTDRALNDLRNIADNRIAQEHIEQRPDKQLLVKEFASEQKPLETGNRSTRIPNCRTNHAIHSEQAFHCGIDRTHPRA